LKLQQTYLKYLLLLVFSLVFISCDYLNQKKETEVSESFLSSLISLEQKDRKFQSLVAKINNVKNDSLRIEWYCYLLENLDENEFKEIQPILLLELKNKNSEYYKFLKKIIRIKALLKFKNIESARTELYTISKSKSQDEYSEMIWNFQKAIFYKTSDSAINGIEYVNRAIELSEKNNSLNYQLLALRLKGSLLMQIEDFDETKTTLLKLNQISSKFNHQEQELFSELMLGETYRFLSQYSKAESYFYKVLSNIKFWPDSNYLCYALGSLAEIERDKGNYSKALTLYFEGMEIAQNIKSNDDYLFCMAGLGDLYYQLGNILKALETQKSVLELSTKIGNDTRKADCLNRLGMIYRDLNRTVVSHNYYDKAIQASKKINDLNSLAIAYGGKGSLFFAEGEFDIATNYFQQQLEIGNELGELESITSSLTNLAKIDYEKKRFKQGIEKAKKALSLLNSNGLLNQKRNVTDALYTLYVANKDNANALKMLQNSISYRDTLNSKEQILKVAAIEFDIKSQKLISQQKKKELEFLSIQKTKELETKQQKLFIYLLLIGLIVAGLFSFFIFRALKKNKIIQKILREQKSLVEEKNHEILDSINYAKRLQQAFLPRESSIKLFFEDGFILYKPKDIVAGDFYWMEEMDGKYYFAAADCTGHGVPGAMVSVVCSIVLNRTLKEFRITDPGKILDKAKELVVETYSKSVDEVKDGMDISLGVFNPFDQTLQWAGANNGIYIIKKNDEFIEIKPNKQSVAFTEKTAPFITHTHKLEKGDSLYLFTDGFADQFGGAKEKKFKYKSLKESILKNHTLPMHLQRQMLEEIFYNWKNDLEQVDDILLIGFKI
jgi:serine phosphatase RsbU (regulator of sigma subunit)